MTTWTERGRDLDRTLYRISGLASVWAFLNRNIRLITYLFLVALLAYGAHLVEFFLAIDAEYHSQRFGPKLEWVSQGRWGMYVLNSLLLPDAVMLFVPTLLAISGLVVGTLLVLHALSDTRGVADYLAAPIAIACPVIYFSLYFTTLGYGIGIGYGLAGLGLFALSRWSWSGMVVAVLAWAFAIGIYQAMAPLIAALFGLYVFARTISQDNAWGIRDWAKRGSVFLVVLMLAFLVYWLVSKLAMHVLSLHFDSEYLSGFVRFTHSWDYWASVWSQTWDYAWKYYSGDKEIYLYDLLSLRLLFSVALLGAILLLVFLPRKGLIVRLLGFLGLSAAFLASISMCLVNSGYMPPRAMLAVPWVLAGMVFVVARHAGYTLRLMLGVLVLACFYNFSVINNRYHFSSYMQWQADRTFSVLLLERLNTLWDHLPPKSAHDQYPVVLVGLRENFETPVFIRREVVGASFYKWDAGNVHRMISLFFSMGISDYRGGNSEEELAVADYGAKMPIWPRDGSVDIVDGIIVVKLSEYHPHQIQSMCSGREVHDFCQRQLSR